MNVPHSGRRTLSLFALLILAQGVSCQREDDPESQGVARAPRTAVSPALPAPVFDDWGTLGRDEGHSGVAPGASGSPPLGPAWVLGLTDVPLYPVVVGDGRVFVTADTYFAPSTRLWALKASDGSALWTHDFGGVFGVGHPTISQGRVFVSQCDHTPGSFLWSFDAASGSVLWSVPVAAQWEEYWSPLVVGDGVYMNGGYYGGLYKFDATTGAQVFFQSLEQYDEWSPAMHNGQVYTFVAGHLRVHDSATGIVQWSVTVPWNWSGWSMKTAPVFGTSLAFVVAPPNLYAVNPVAQAVAWSTAGLDFKGMPCAAGGVVYAISGGTLRAHDQATGAFLWSFAGDAKLEYPPVVAGNHLYVSSTDHVYGVNLTTHAQVWAANGGGWLSIAAGKLFVAGHDGVLRAHSFAP